MSEQRLAYLFQQCLDQVASAQEKQELYNLMKEPGNEALVKSYIIQLLENPRETADVPDETMRSILQAIFEANSARTATVKPGYAYRRYGWWAAAAVILFLLAIGTQRQMQPSPKQAAGEEHVKNDVMPGGNKAVLTLSDGSAIELDSAGSQVIRQGNMAIHQQGGQLQYNVQGREAAVSYNTLSTPRGGQFQVRLPDGSQVWLNAASSIKYPTAFTGKERRVEVTGEAYFEIAANSKMPFKASVNNQVEIQVLGTHFNINAYINQNHISTTLLKGSVKVLKGKESALLLPGEQAAVASNSPATRQILVRTVDVEKVMAWKNGLFDFEDAGLEEVMQQLERWYDIEVIYEKGVPDLYFAGKMSKDLNLSEILGGLQKAGVHFRLEQGRKLIVMP